MQAAFDTRFRFNGKEMDPETGNYYYGARYYDPKVSVWLSVDPLANHQNQINKSPYAFSWNNPLKYVDKDGRCPECDENIKNPEIGQIYESSGGQIYQYQETFDEDGNNTGAAWTGLGGVLSEAQVGPGADNSATVAVDNTMVTSPGEIMATTLILTASTSEIPPAALAILATGCLITLGYQLAKSLNNPFPKPWYTDRPIDHVIEPRFPGGGGGKGPDWLKWLTSGSIAVGVLYGNYKYDKLKKDLIESSNPQDKTNVKTPINYQIKPNK